jgi:FkbM family methyltransferase
MLENCAIAKESGTRVLYTMADDPSLPSWSSNMSSFDRRVLLKHAPEIPNIKKFIRKRSVRCITLDDLFGRYNVRHIDLLQIDAEGYDYDILMMLDFTKWKPVIINYESKHFPARKQVKLMNTLTAHGYKVRSDGHDTLAHLQPSRLRSS